MEEDDKLLNLAKEKAREFYEGDRRISGENLYDHVLAVSRNLEKIGIKDKDMLIAALFHAPFADGSTKKDDFIAQKFGSEAFDIVLKYRTLSDSVFSEISPKELDEQRVIKTYMNLTQDPRVLLIRLSDKVTNIVTAFALDKDKKIKVAEKALYLYAPLCHVLGIREYYVILEDEAFKILYPSEFNKITKYIDKNLVEIQKMLSEAEIVIKELLAEKNIKAELSFRIKHPYSIYKKYVTSKKPVRRDLGYFDIAAGRVIVDTVEQCYSVEDMLKELWDWVPEERNDYIINPKPNGYRSIHNLFKAHKNFLLEIQLRTHEMHEQNEFGPASHSIYKLGAKIKDLTSRGYDWSAQFKKNRGYITKNIESARFIYCFTPKGDIIELPKGSCPIDFAFEIHADLGEHYSGALINGKIVSQDYELKTGDLVKIIETNRKNVNRDWLKHVKTKKAQSEIKKELKKIGKT